MRLENGSIIPSLCFVGLQDEGHAMGTSAVTSCGNVARRVEAERR